MNDVARMIKSHLGKILNYFIYIITNARVDGINSKIALIHEMHTNLETKSPENTNIL